MGQTEPSLPRWAADALSRWGFAGELNELRAFACFAGDVHRDEMPLTPR